MMSGVAKAAGKILFYSIAAVALFGVATAVWVLVTDHVEECAA